MFKLHFLKKLHTLRIFIIILTIAIISTIPAFLHGTFKLSFDGNIHLSRYESIFQAFQHGSLPTLVNFIGMNHTGLSMNGMYPWVTSIIFVIPRFFINQPIIALMIGFIILNFITIFNTFLLAKFITNKRSVQILGIAIYQFSSYHMSVLYSRNAMGEAIAYAFLPLVLLGCLKIWENPKNTGWILLGFGMAAIANSHVISLIIASAMVFILIFLRLINQKLSSTELFTYLKAIILAVCASLYSLINIFSIATSNFLINPTPKILPIIPSKLLPILLDNSIIERANSFNIGPINTLLLFIFVILLFTSQHKGRWRGWIIATTILFFCTFSWIPWNILINTPVQLIQFLGRLLFVVSLLLSISVMYYLDENKLPENKFKYFISLSLMIVSLSAVYNYHGINLNDGTRFWLTKNNYQKIITHSSIGLDYLPSKNESQRKQRISDFRHATKLKLSPIKQYYNRATYQITVPSQGKYQLPIAIYSGISYIVKVNDKTIDNISGSSLKTHLNKGKNNIAIKALVNPLNYITFLISILSWLYGFVLIYLYHTKNCQRKH